jgi:hypothetical protein
VDAELSACVEPHGERRVEAPELWRWSSFRAYCLSRERDRPSKRVERPQAEVPRSDNFPAVKCRTYPGLEKRETRATRHGLDPSQALGRAKHKKYALKSLGGCIVPGCGN